METKSEIREIIESLAIAVLIVTFVTVFVGRFCRVKGRSMEPTLHTGEWLWTDKIGYDLGSIKRGDVVVLKYHDTREKYVKRVIGLPGDKVAYKGKRLTINGEAVQTQPAGAFTDGGLNRYPAFMEKIGEHSHVSMVVPSEPPVRLHEVRQFPHRDNCEYNDDGFSCTVPPGQYFMMGDNRDQSADSRYWGFVPDDHLKGRAFLVWLNLGDLKRVGNKIE